MRSNANSIIRSGPPSDVAARADAFDWTQASGDLDARGCAFLNNLLTPDQCRELAALYPDDTCFRSRIVMRRHGFGRGEYKYFAYPLPDLIAQLRPVLYARLYQLANRWNEAMGIDIRYPPAHQAFLERCHAAGQTRPTPRCCNMAPATTTACIRTFTASTFSRCRSRSCCPSRDAILPAASSC